MNLDLRKRQQLHDAPARPGTETILSLRQRLAIAALVAGLNLWIRVVERTGEPQTPGDLTRVATRRRRLEKQ